MHTSGEILTELAYEPIAIVGFAFKFPGDADTVEGFWDMMVEARCASTSFPAGRMDLSGIYHPDEGRTHTISHKGGHFLREDVAAFDAPFFSISPVEAASMDPQQRFLLETTGIPMHSVAGSRTCVFTGSFTDDYKLLYTKDIDEGAPYAATGTAASFNSNRLSWFLNLRGNSVTVDTACSSSLVALDLACKSLQNGDSDMGIVTGVNLVLAPDFVQMLSDMNMLSPDGRSWSFDPRGNEYGRGEGVAVLVIKRLEDALRDGDTIRAVIRATGSNSDGYTPGITQPHSSSQEHLIRDCYKKAGLDISCMGYFEAHGTGTPAGDHVEANAFGAAFSNRAARDPLYIGAVKSNIGHLEGASGLAGIIKAIMVMERGMIPPIADLESLNPRIDEESLGLKFPRNALPWPSCGLTRVSVNSFGFGGTNSHAVLDDALHFLQEHGLEGVHCTTPMSAKCGVESVLTLPTRICSQKRELGPPVKTFVFSAADKAGLSRLSEAYSGHLQQIRRSYSDEDFRSYLGNLAYSLAMRRDMLTWPSILKRTMTPPIRGFGSKPKVAFIFTGQGAQWATMGKELFAYPVFADSLRNAEIFLLSLGCTWKLTDELLRPSSESNIDEPRFSQPICTALQLALVQLLHACGVFPDAVVGHSSGEIAAAFCVGAISEKAALTIAYMRGVCASALQPSDETMISFESLVIACHNSPSNITIAGPQAAIDSLKVKLDEKAIFARKLKVQLAYHSPQMHRVAEHYSNSLAELHMDAECGSKSAVMMFSLLGRKVTTADLRTPGYWVRNLISPVLFSAAFECIFTGSKTKKLDHRHLERLNVDICVEVSPHAALRGPICDILTSRNQSNTVHYVSMLERHKDSLITFSAALGQLHSNHPMTAKSHDLVSLCTLPSYPFDHSRKYWHDSRIARNNRFQKEPRLDLLGKRVADWNKYQARWRHFIRVKELPWIEHHKIYGTTLLPAASMLTMAIEAMKQLIKPNGAVRGFELRDFHIHTAVTIPPDSVQMEIHLGQSHDPRRSDLGCRLFALVDGQWIECCNGTARIDYPDQACDMDDGVEESELLKQYQLRQRKNQLAEAADVAQFYNTLAGCGYGFGPAFQSLVTLKFAKTSATGDVCCFRWTEAAEAGIRQDHVVHPCTLDGMIQLGLAAITQGGTLRTKTMVPTLVRRLWICGAGLDWPQHECATVSAEITKNDRNGVEMQASALCREGTQVGAILEGVRLTHVAGSSEELDADPQQALQHTLWNLAWKPDIDLTTGSSLSNLCHVEGNNTFSPVGSGEELTFLLYQYLDMLCGEFSVEKAVQLPPYLDKYLSWARLQRDKHHDMIAPGSDHTYESLARNESYISSVLENLQDQSAQIKTYTAIGNKLVGNIRADVDVLELLFHSDLAQAHYEEFSISNNAFPALARYLDAYSHKYPGASYLEVGAGTGGSTLAILESLSRSKEGPYMYKDYTFTDISESFFDRARDRLHEFPRVGYRRLDIEKAPETQGFIPGSFDCIMAANVVHATSSLATTLGLLHRLLKPGGRIILFEITKPQMLCNGFIFGLLPGWWLSSEQFRNHGYGPCLQTEEWNRVLVESDFTGVELELRDWDDEACHEMSILISSKNNPISSSYGLAVTIASTAASCQTGDSSRLLDAFMLMGVAPTDVNLVQGLPNTRGDICVVQDHPIMPILRDLTPTRLDSLQRLFKAYSTVIWVTQATSDIPHPDLAAIDGLARTIQQEYYQTKMVTVMLGPNGLTFQKSRQIAGIACQTFHSDDTIFEPAFQEIKGRLHISRLVESEIATEKIRELASEMTRCHVPWAGSILLKMIVGSPRSPPSLHCIEDHEYKRPLAVREVEIKAEVMGLNFKDCLGGLDQADDFELGLECAGTITRLGSEAASVFQLGDRVCMAAVGLFRTYIRSTMDCVCRLPAKVSMVQGATIPIQFLTVWRTLVDLADLKKNESIHTGADGTGQAAIQVARYIGAKVFTTVDSAAKRASLVNAYGLEESHVLYGRDTRFAKGIHRLTGGGGVDVVLNTLAGDNLAQSWDAFANPAMPMLSFDRCTSFFSFDWSTWTRDRPQELQQTLKTVIDMFDKKLLQESSPIDTFAITEAESAINFLASGNGCGKVVVKASQDATVPVSLVITYVVAGGLGGVGPKTDVAIKLMEKLKTQGVDARAPPCDISDKHVLQRTLKECLRSMPAIKGCIQASMVLQVC
ncbi:ketoacyl-synt-domain-containing protein [Myriangium duriaei CBS 260.36]|uniref:Ketoacyl-synt-domain-containing protein n=1 Tax=Myriangium duriaei CBS 260.36 TaxID=1168546 RepID=A0A9P4MKR7_9PEZI|nr:ketoacyl-synt-domain-containing protein [Myriangium duriaei CBS 260.36]